MLPPAEKYLHCIVLSLSTRGGVIQKREGRKKALRSGRRGRHEFVARDFRGNATLPFSVGSYAQPLQAADIYIAR